MQVAGNGATTATNAPKRISSGQVDINAMGGFFPVIEFPDKAVKPGESWSKKTKAVTPFEGVETITERKYTLEYYTTIKNDKCAKILIDTKSYQTKTEAAKKHKQAKKFSMELATKGYAFYRLKDKRLIEIQMDVTQDMCIPVKQLGTFIATKSRGKLANILDEPKKPDK